MAIYFFPLPFLGAGLLWLVFLVVLRRRKKSLRYLAIFSIFWWYLMLVAALTLFPWIFPPRGGVRLPLAEILARVNLTPFHLGPAARFAFRLRGEMILNIFLTVPFGLLLPMLLRLRRRAFLGYALGIGLSIELGQLLLNLVTGRVIRVTDVNDVILNFSGALIGYCVYWLARWLGRRLRTGAKR